MKTASVTQVAADFVVYLKASQQGPVVVTRKGKPVAVLVSAASDEDVERLVMGHSPKLQAILDSARKRFRAGRGIPHETFWQEVEVDGVARMKKRRTSARKK